VFDIGLERYLSIAVPCEIGAGDYFLPSTSFGSACFPPSPLPGRRTRLTPRIEVGSLTRFAGLYCSIFLSVSYF